MCAFLLFDVIVIYRSLRARVRFVMGGAPPALGGPPGGREAGRIQSRTCSPSFYGEWKSNRI